MSEGTRMRSLTTSDGGTVIERLEAFDHTGKNYSYSIIQAPFPVNVSDEDVVKLFTSIYQDALKANF